MHRRTQDYAYFKGLRPAVVKIMDGGNGDYLWVKDNLPDALVIARDHPMSEQHDDMLRDPVGTGNRHATEWKAHSLRLNFDPAKTFVLGINEPKVWEAGVPDALRKYTVAFLDKCHSLGLRAGALQFSVGWPANTGEGTRPNWAPYLGVGDAIKRGNHVLVCHEYWADQGPDENWGWWGGRWMHCPWDVPVIIAETGIDMYVKYGGGWQGSRGWVNNVDAPAFARQLTAYNRRCQSDKRFFAATTFATDFADPYWATFDTERAATDIVVTASNLPAAVWYPPPGPIFGPLPPEVIAPRPPILERNLVHPLPEGSRRITQKFNQTMTNSRGHEGTDFGAVGGTPVSSIAAGVVAWSDEDKFYGNYVRVWHKALQCHSFYAHLKSPGVAQGTILRAGSVIGNVGTTGNSTGNHLHFEIRIANADGSYKPAPKVFGRVDPESFCAEHDLIL